MRFLAEEIAISRRNQSEIIGGRQAVTLIVLQRLEPTRTFDPDGEQFLATDSEPSSRNLAEGIAAALLHAELQNLAEPLATDFIQENLVGIRKSRAKILQHDRPGRDGLAEATARRQGH